MYRSYPGWSDGSNSVSKKVLVFFGIKILEPCQWQPSSFLGKVTLFLEGEGVLEIVATGHIQSEGVCSYLDWFLFYQDIRPDTR